MHKDSWGSGSMLVIVEIWAEGNQRPPAGVPIRVEVRDTSLIDAPSRTVGAAEGQVRGQASSWLDTLEVEVPSPCSHCIIWAHVDVDNDHKVSSGDFVTTVAYPVPSDSQARLTINVKKV